MDGISKTRLYAIFSGMKQRCYNQNCDAYRFYGGKGITMWTRFFLVRLTNQGELILKQ